MGIEINTKEILNKWETELLYRIDNIKKEYGKPWLSIVRVGNREDSKLYVNNKLRKAEKLGIETSLFELDEKTRQQDLNELMSVMRNPTILQLPLPDHLDAAEAMSHLRPELDVDGLATYQKGLLVDGREEAMVPATALGVVRILESITDLKGTRVAIVSRSELIGKPLAQLILQKNGYPVILHSKVPTMIMFDEIANSQIVVTGCGQRAIFDHRHFRISGQVIIDCSMTRVRNIPGVGDVNKEDIINNTMNSIASGFGHTGPATVMGLMNNVVKYYEMMM